MKKLQLDGVEVNDTAITIIRDWAATDLDVSRPEMHAKSIGKVQDVLTRYMTELEPDERITMTNCLCSLIIIKDDLMQMSHIWDKKGGEAC
jgi:hypothetical protein